VIFSFKVNREKNKLVNLTIMTKLYILMTQLDLQACEQLNMKYIILLQNVVSG
jgi:hypothetical protein